MWSPSLTRLTFGPTFSTTPTLVAADHRVAVRAALANVLV